METVTETKERPILFSGLMVRAILKGRKTQTRRVVKPQPIKQHHIAHVNDPGWSSSFHVLTNRAVTVETLPCPYGLLRDRLWVRETWGLHDTQPSDGPENAQIYYRSTDGERHDLRYQKWRPSIFMPRWASRITLEITDVRVERVQEITPDGAISEGATEWGQEEGQRRNYDKSGKRRNVPLGPSIFDGRKRGVPYLVNAFAELWNSINAKRGFGWDKNPWVWVVEFRKCEPAK